MLQLGGGKAGEVKRVDLQEPNIAKSKKDQRGTWTMVYDEGFQVDVDGFNFFSFSNYSLKVDPVTKVKQNVSHCGDTTVGWYHNMDRTVFGCFYAHKIEKQAPVPVPKATLATKSVHHDTPLDHKAMAKKVAKINQKLNMLQLGWKARVMSKFIGKTMREINNYAGIKRTVPKHDVFKDMIHQQNIPHARSFLQAKGVKPHGGKLPQTFDWSNATAAVVTQPPPCGC